MSQSKETPLLNLLVERATLKQDVYKNTLKQFAILREVITAKVDDLRKNIHNKDVRISVLKSSEVEMQVAIGSDILVFHMHTNVFRFPDENPIWQSSYLTDHPELGYCGIINVYNFLYDSFHYGRMNDPGYLIGRIFVNKENHFIMDGKGQLGFLFKDFVNNKLDKKAMNDLIEQAFYHAIEFDMLTPPYDLVSEVTVYEIQNLISDLKLKTGKRLGFHFKAENDTIT
jgi:hypothetical protein